MSQATTTAAMTPQQFANALRACRKGRFGTQVREVAEAECLRLGVTPGNGAAPPAGLVGSDSVDYQSIFAWMRKVRRDDVEAVAQVKALAAAAPAEVA